MFRASLVQSEPLVTATVLPPDEYLARYLGHRRLTRRVIAAFPAGQFETFSVGGMRPFGSLVRELLAMGAPMFRAFATDEWPPWDEDRTPMSQSAALSAWDAATPVIEASWPGLLAKGLEREITIYGQWPGTVAHHLMYLLENEIHHRAQGYVYLRALGVEPPPFWER
jgi:uncharacterized damage-inducible protein DinB